MRISGRIYKVHESEDYARTLSSAKPWLNCQAVPKYVSELWIMPHIAIMRFGQWSDMTEELNKRDSALVISYIQQLQ